MFFPPFFPLWWGRHVLHPVVLKLVVLLPVGLLSLVTPSIVVIDCNDTSDNISLFSSFVPKPLASLHIVTISCNIPSRSCASALPYRAFLERPCPYFPDRVGEEAHIISTRTLLRLSLRSSDLGTLIDSSLSNIMFLPTHPCHDTLRYYCGQSV